jgi:hypothetical protein
VRYIIEAISHGKAVFGNADQTYRQLIEVEADSAEAAARKAKSRCSVGNLADGVELVVCTLQEHERWHFQYEYPDGNIFEGRPYGEAVGIRTSVKAG